MKRGAARIVFASALAGAVVVGALPAWAYFADVATLTAGPSTAHVVQRPDSTACSAAMLSGTVSWPTKDARYDYEVVLRRVSTGTVVSTRQVTGAAVSTTYTGLADFGLVVGAGTVDFQVEVSSYLATAPAWRSAQVRTYANLRVVAIAIGATVSCTT